MADVAMTLSDAAVARMRMILEQSQQAALRLSVRAAGCSGLEYVLEEVDGAQAGDLCYEQDGVRLFVDAESYTKALTGLHIDFQKDMLSSAFVYQNPNKKGECGCGISFTV